MTVKELITLLLEANSDATVVVDILENNLIVRDVWIGSKCVELKL